MKQPSFTIGIEEEYLLVNRETRALIVDPPPSIVEECAEKCGGQVSPEFLRSQIEVGTRVCRSVGEATQHLGELRGAVADVVSRYGLAPIAASTHPFSQWQDQKHTEQERYIKLARDLQGVAQRMVICGMHVHVGIDDDNLRIDLMNQFSYFLPHLLALSCSSPFWNGRNTGLKSYRLTIIGDLPRTSLPERFESYAEYQRHVDILVRAGLLEDATKIWWDVRPSARYPTLEMRVTDTCTSLTDAASLAALTVCLLRMLFRLRRANQRWRTYSAFLINENRWRAMRYSYDEGLVDFGKASIVSCKDLFEELIEHTDEDAEELNCVDELNHVRTIMRRGTSAHRQLQVYQDAKTAGAGDHEALQAVVDFLITETVRHIPGPGA